ncbi:MAG: PqqD family protein [Thermoanaerobaculia bacterium]
MKWETTSSVAWQMVGPEAVLVDVATGTTLGLNPTGSFIWKRLRENDDAAIATELAREYGIPREEADRDVADFLELLRDRGFVSPKE